MGGFQCEWVELKISKSNWEVEASETGREGEAIVVVEIIVNTGNLPESEGGAFSYGEGGGIFRLSGKLKGAREG